MNSRTDWTMMASTKPRVNTFPMKMAILVATPIATAIEVKFALQAPIDDKLATKREEKFKRNEARRQAAA